MTTLHLSATRPASCRCLVCNTSLERRDQHFWARNTWTERLRDYHEAEREELQRRLDDELQRMSAALLRFDAMMRDARAAIRLAEEDDGHPD